jgi:RNA polymerase sigma factor (sigma-70 family)
VRTPELDEARLRAAFDAYAARVLAYAIRHVDSHTAHDVVSEVFLTAWRRVADLPAEPLPWLLVVARHTIHNRARSVTRQRRLADRVAALDAAAATSPGAEDTVVERLEVTAALAQLSHPEREALLLTAWDGLTAADAASVAGCSRHAFEVRLHRARARLRRSLAESDGPAADPNPHLPAACPAQEILS